MLASIWGICIHSYQIAPGKGNGNRYTPCHVFSSLNFRLDPADQDDAISGSWKDCQLCRPWYQISSTCQLWGLRSSLMLRVVDQLAQQISGLWHALVGDTHSRLSTGIMRRRVPSGGNEQAKHETRNQFTGLSDRFQGARSLRDAAQRPRCLLSSVELLTWRTGSYLLYLHAHAICICHNAYNSRRRRSLPNVVGRGL